MSTERALTCAEGLLEVVQTVPEVQAAFIGEPGSIHVCPCAYITLQTRGQPLTNAAPSGSTINGFTYQYNIRLVLYWQDNEQAERELMSLVDAIPAAVSADPRLGGRVSKGIATCGNGVAGYIEMGGIVYRVFDYAANVLDKGQ